MQEAKKKSNIASIVFKVKLEKIFLIDPTGQVTTNKLRSNSSRTCLIIGALLLKKSVIVLLYLYKYLVRTHYYSVYLS